MKQDEGAERKKVTSEGYFLEVKLPGIQPYEPDDSGRRRWDKAFSMVLDTYDPGRCKAAQ